MKLGRGIDVVPEIVWLNPVEVEFIFRTPVAMTP